MTVAGINGSTEMTTEQVSASVAGIDSDGQGEKMKLYTHPKIDVGQKTYNFSKLKEQYGHLNNIPDVTVSLKDVKVILGQDAYHLHRPLEYKSGKRSEPWAFKNLLDGLSVAH